GRNWNTRRLCDDFSQLVQQSDGALPNEVRESMAQSVFEMTTERWATHPSPSERAAKVAGLDGIVPASEASACVLFRAFDEHCRRATLFHYHHTLGEQLKGAAILTASQFLTETANQRRRVEAIQSCFGQLNMPSRWFRLPDGPLQEETLKVFLSEEDQTVKY